MIRPNGLTMRPHLHVDVQVVRAPLGLLAFAIRLSLRLTSGSVLGGAITSKMRPTSAPKKSGGVTPTIMNGT